MRQGQKRSRGRGNTYNANQRGNQSNKNILTRSHESNGPDVKVRGTPAAIVEKYQQLARDAQSSGDGVMAEAYFQHAEHYYRLIQVHTAQQEEQQREREAREQKDREAREARGESPDRDGRDGDDADGEDGRGRRGRRRRNRDDRDAQPRGERSDDRNQDRDDERSAAAEGADAPAPTLAASDAEPKDGGVIGDPPQARDGQGGNGDAKGDGGSDGEEKPRRTRRARRDANADGWTDDGDSDASASASEAATSRPRTRRTRRAAEPASAPDAEVAGNTADELPSFIADPAE